MEDFEPDFTLYKVAGGFIIRKFVSSGRGEDDLDVMAGENITCVVTTKREALMHLSRHIDNMLDTSTADVDVEEILGAENWKDL